MDYTQHNDQDIQQLSSAELTSIVGGIYTIIQILPLIAPGPFPAPLPQSNPALSSAAPQMIGD